MSSQTRNNSTKNLNPDSKITSFKKSAYQQDNLKEEYFEEPSEHSSINSSGRNIQAEVNNDESVDERIPEEGQSEGYEESEAELINAAEGNYIPSQTRKINHAEKYQNEGSSTVVYGEADSEHPQDL